MYALNIITTIFHPFPAPLNQSFIIVDNLSQCPDEAMVRLHCATFFAVFIEFCRFSRIKFSKISSSTEFLEGLKFSEQQNSLVNFEVCHRSNQLNITSALQLHNSPQNTKGRPGNSPVVFGSFNHNQRSSNPLFSAAFGVNFGSVDLFCSVFARKTRCFSMSWMRNGCATTFFCW